VGVFEGIGVDIVDLDALCLLSNADLDKLGMHGIAVRRATAAIDILLQPGVAVR